MYMKTKNLLLLLGFLAGIIAVSCNQAKQQGKEVAPSARYKMTTDIPAPITTPDVVETSLGTMRFFDGFPDEATVKKVYDNLDLQRGVQVFLTAFPAPSMLETRRGYRTFGPENKTILISESFLDSRSLYLVSNTETIYLTLWADTKDGPLVIETPPDVLGFIDDFWCRYVIDMGRAGPDKGKGGKFLLLPPDYKGDVPEGYFVAHSPTYGNFLFMRGFVKNGDLVSTVENMKKYFRIYPLTQAANPPAMNFVNISGQYFNCIPANDASFYNDLDQVVQEEPLESVDPEVRGLLAAIGIRKGMPFAPDERMKGILTDAAAVGNATARAIFFETRDPDASLYPNSDWKMGFIGSDVNFSPGGVLNPDARTRFYYGATGVTPAMMVKMVGIGSQYAMAGHDATGKYLDGAKNYRLHLPPNVPAKDFWSLIVYDPQTRSLLQTNQQFPSAGNQRKGIVINPDNSVDVWFGPVAPPGNEANWIQTIPGKGWWIILRLYGPLEPWFDKTWRPGEIELVQSIK
jgi:hypothetical protein